MPRVPAAEPVTVESLTEKHVAEVNARMAELHPAYEEYLTLDEYKGRLTGQAPARRQPARTAATTSGTARRSRRASGDGPGRRTQFMQVLKDQPASTIPDIAKAIEGVSPNYLYRVRDGLSEDGFIVEGDTGHFTLTDAGQEALASETAAEPVTA